MSILNYKYVNEAIKEAKKSEFSYVNGSSYRLGAIVIKNGKIIGRGYNCKTTNDIFKLLGYKFSIHAEALSLVRAKKDGDTIIVVRILKDNSLSMAMPCKKCYKFIKKCGIKTIVFSDWNGEIKSLSI